MKGFQKLARRVLVDWSPYITVTLLILSIVGAYLGSSIKLKLSLSDLLPADHPAVVKFEEITKVVGGVGYFSIILTAEDRKTHLASAPQLIEELKKSELVRDAFIRREQRFFVDRMLYYSTVAKLEEMDASVKREIRQARESVIDLGLWDDAEKSKKEEKPAFDSDLKKLAKKSAKITPFLTSKDNLHLLVMVKPSFDSTDLEKSEELIGVVESAIKKTVPESVTYRFAERYYKKVIETKIIQNDIFYLGLLGIGLILIALFLYLRDWRGLVVVFLPIAMSLGITTGITRLAIGHINIVTGFLMGILSGLGVDYAIHLYLRLPLEKREPSSDDPDPVWRAIFSAGHAIFVGALSAAFAFYLLVFSSFKAFSEFGFVCGTGIITVFICLMCSFSSLTRLLGLDKTPAKPVTASSWQFPVLSLPKGLAVGVVIFVGLLFYASQVSFEYDFDRMMRHSEVLAENQETVDEIYGRSITPSAYLAPTEEVAIALENKIKEKYMPDVVTEVISGVTIIPDDQEKKAVILARMKNRLKTIKPKWIRKTLGVDGDTVNKWLSAETFSFTDLPNHLQDFLRGKTSTGYLMYMYPAINLSNANGVKQWANMIRDLDSQFPDALSGADAVVFADILNLIDHDGTLVLFAILIFVGIFIFVNTRRLDDSLASYLPLLFALPVGMGLMALFGVKFNIFNICIIPAFVAIGIDIPLHIVHRAREVGSGYKSVRDLAASSNLALITTGLGFGALAFANSAILRSLGWIAILGTLAIWFVGLLLLPAVLEWYLAKEPSQPAKIASEPPKSKSKPSVSSSETVSPNPPV